MFLWADSVGPLPVPSPPFFSYRSSMLRPTLQSWLLFATCWRLVCFYLPIPNPVDARPRGRIGGGSFRYARYPFPAGGAGNFFAVASGGGGFGVREIGFPFPLSRMFGFGGGACSLPGS